MRGPTGIAVGYGVSLPGVRGTPLVRQSPHRQPRRDRHPRHAHLPRARHRDRRGVLRPRPRRPPRALRRRGLRARRADARRELPQRRGDPRSHRAQRRRGGAPGIRLLLGERRLRPHHHRAGRHVDRPAARGDRGDGRQDLVAQGGGRRRRGLGAGHPRPHHGPGRDRHLRERPRVADRDQGRLRRRREGHQDRRERGRGRARVRVGDARGPGLLRAARVLPRAVPHPAPPHRDPGVRRHPRQRGRPRRTRLLNAAPPAEADRGDARRPHCPTTSARRCTTPRSRWHAPAAT